MTPDEWLKENNKKPFTLGNRYPRWYWMTYLYYDNKVLTEEEVKDDIDSTLPVAIWNHLQAKTTYPYVKLYHSDEEALEDFRQAYDKAVAEGSITDEQKTSTP